MIFIFATKEKVSCTLAIVLALYLSNIPSALYVIVNTHLHLIGFFFTFDNSMIYQAWFFLGANISSMAFLPLQLLSAS